MSSYIDRLGMCDLPRHDHLIVKSVNYEKNLLTIEFEPDNIITNCTYSFDMEYGIQYEIDYLTGNTISFEPVGGHYNEQELKEAAENIKAGDKMYFHSKFPIGGEYHNGRPFKYAEL